MSAGSPFGRSPFGGARSVFGEASEGGTVDLNLTPLMDVMSNILFFLLASVGASIVALLPASVPTRSESAVGAEANPKQLMVKLQITPAGYSATMENEKLPPAELSALRFALSKKGAEPWAMPYEDLTAKLFELKKKYPASDTVVMLPDPTVPYQVIIRTMDAARGVSPQEAAKDASRPTAEVVRKNPGDPANLFTKVVISDLVK